MASINLITNSCNNCFVSFFCCSTNIDDLTSQGLDLNNLEKSLRDINDKNYKEAKWDFGKLETKIINHPVVKYSRKKVANLIIWGGDSLNSFYCLQENINFVKYINKKHNLNIRPYFCTNGLGLLIPEWVEYLIKENIHFSLLHDGLGQEIRTIDFDPINFDGFKEVCKHKLITSFDLVLNQYNSSPIANYDWFEENTPHDIAIRIGKIKNGFYDSKNINKSGICNGLYYKELKGKPYGDFLIHNDYTNDILARQLDIYIDDWKYIYSNLDKFKRAEKAAINFANLNDGVRNKNNCYNFQNGIINYSNTIDTVGNDCDCFLMSNKFKAKYKGAAEYCNGCKFNGRYECKECNVMSFPDKDRMAPNGCKFNYRYQELMDYANDKISDFLARDVVYVGTDLKNNRSNKLLPYYEKSGFVNILKCKKLKKYKTIVIENPYFSDIEDIVNRGEKIVYDRTSNWSIKNENGRKYEEIIFKKADIIINSSEDLVDDSLVRAKIGANVYCVIDKDKSIEDIFREIIDIIYGN